MSGFQSAINDSSKDEFRKAFSLNYLKQQLYYQKKYDESEQIERFQNQPDHPYKEVYGAVGVFSDDSYIVDTVKEADTKEHPGRANLKLIVFRGPDLMELAHELYKRAADEA